MKKIIFLFIALLGVCFVYGQDITDAVRYSNDEVKGTARFRAMGGAFGALGGDLSAVNINPASSAVFTQSRASFTTGFNSISNNSEYFGSSLSDTDSNINFYQELMSAIRKNISEGTFDQFHDKYIDKL